MVDRLFVGGTRGAALLAGVIVILIVAFVLREAMPALRQIGIARVLVDPGWYPTLGQYRLTPMLAGTLAVSLGAVALAAPLGLASAVYGRFYAGSRVGFVHRRIIELLAGIPSVVFGLWGLTTLVPIVARIEPPGASLLTAIVVLTLMILPTIAVTADAALGAVPVETRLAAEALGLGRSTTLWRIMIPAAGRGIGVGVLLALGRAIGETMAVLMVAGNVVQVPRGLLEPFRAVTANIALEMGYATETHRSVLFVSGLALIALIAVLVVTVELLGGLGRGRAGG